MDIYISQEKRCEIEAVFGEKKETSPKGG